MLDKTTKVNILYDIYGSLLTDKQKEYIELYYREDYSLQEIAEQHKVSRQAVYDNIKRTEQLLTTYEDKLRLYQKHLIRQKQLIALKMKIDEVAEKELKNQLLSIIDQLHNID